MQTATAINTEIHAVATACHLDVTAFAAYLEYEGDDDCMEDAAESFQDSYAGTFFDLGAWAESFIEDTGMLSDIPENIRRYFNFEAWARDAELSGDVWTTETNAGTAVFWNR